MEENFDRYKYISFKKMGLIGNSKQEKKCYVYCATSILMSELFLELLAMLELVAL